MSGAIIWVHEDCLSPHNPALAAAPGAPALFVFDDGYIAEAKLSLKRVMFIYECLLQLPVTIRRGDAAAQIVAFAHEHDSERIVTTETNSLRLNAIWDAAGKGVPAATRLEVMPVAPFVPYTGDLDLKRFSRYWSAVRDLALRK